MTRTQVLPEIRRMRLEEACGGWQSRRLTQEEAARLSGVCERTFRRYVDRYEDEGRDGLADKRSGSWAAGYAFNRRSGWALRSSDTTLVASSQSFKDRARGPGFGSIRRRSPAD